MPAARSPRLEDLPNVCAAPRGRNRATSGFRPAASELVPRGEREAPGPATGAGHRITTGRRIPTGRRTTTREELGSAAISASMPARNCP
jgi:hypothetical protein